MAVIGWIALLGGFVLIHLLMHGRHGSHARGNGGMAGGCCGGRDDE